MTSGDIYLSYLEVQDDESQLGKLQGDNLNID